MAESRVFSKNRALGYVSNHIPLNVRYIQRRKENLIVTSVGKSFHTYGCSHFTLLTVSPSHTDDITCLSGDAYHVYTAADKNIYAWRRGNELKHTYTGHNAPVHIILPFGPNILSVDEDSIVKVWDIRTEEELLELTFNNNIFKITCMIHPLACINKILLASEQGTLQLWNINTSKKIYDFNGWQSAVTAIEQAPALYVVAVGLANGKIKLFNFQIDEVLFELVQSWGIVTSISFRTDDNPIMVTGTTQGHIIFWDLEKKKVVNELINAHFKSIAGLKFLSNEPLIVTNSEDNSLKLWDCRENKDPTLLRIREGHSEPLTCLKFYGNDGHNILTSGEDSSLRICSTIAETFNKSLGKASFDRKASKKKNSHVKDNLIMPRITEFSFETTREKDWDNIAAQHLGLGVVTTWSYDKLKMGEHKLLHDRFKKNYNANSTALTMTQCGNFVIIGFNTGHIDRYNIQSGILRATYGDKKYGAHEGAVKGIMVDSLNQTVVSAGHDCYVKFWSFKSKLNIPKQVVKLIKPIEWLKTHRESSLIALALEDFSIILMDLDSRRVVRHFIGHEAQLKDATFSPDARWLVSSSMDCTIRTWDIPSGKMIDIFQVPEACISLTFSPTGQYLATAHVENYGVYLWSNKTLFSHVSLKAIQPNAPVPSVTLPGTLSEQTDNNEEITTDNQEQEDDIYVSPEQLSEDLITMSLLANSRWQNLLNIDIVKKRNKPKDPPKAPEAAPFFLPTIPSLEFKFDLSTSDKIEDDSKIIIPQGFSNLTVFGRQLQATINSNDYTVPIDRLKSLGPSSIDIEIQSLSLDMTLSTTLMLQFMKMIKYMMETYQNFELSQAYLAVFLKSHGTIIQNDEILWKYLEELQQVQTKTWSILQEKLFFNLSVVQHLKKL
ncbi:hypothetical protein HCN44_000219 [Aphidius gifuensis]|uniref:WD repeat-containing protein 36 n=1 Tax=Aphidius gifuensis TaxID=684658 RepID=A0A834XSC8_APHGI|nr:WD repeat-containing protein 36 [Aphidius gifuensis]KAF7990414.1 hypothetical protein HCN44_000219 [Aphidius gifuensis]